MTDAMGLGWEKKVGNVSSNSPAINVPPSIFGMVPYVEKSPFLKRSQFSGKPSNVSNPYPSLNVLIKYLNDEPW